MIEPTLIVMAKAPRIGFGKSRLAAEVGAVEAWRIARALLAATLRAARQSRLRTIICASPDRDAHNPRLWPQRVARAPQGTGDLGARLARALNGRRNVIVIGTDCPSLTATVLRQSVRCLSGSAFVIGPALDGGFYLLAAQQGRAAAAAMRNVRWSSAHTLADVTRNLPSPPRLLALLRDVDSLEDWRALQRSARRASSA
ncbi:MAG: DUF2064 domain-containing protein [Alphaproteobacteria bacterium]|nr:DUF2064 domain-containing protein [Alphaproteobacteria bacterium]